jgi:hypothetical protein
MAPFLFSLIIAGQLPFPGHLLVSFFSPFKEITWPGYPAGVPRQDLLGFDTVRMIYPWQAFNISEIKSGRLPLWNPSSFAGAPHLANWQSAVFFPLNWLYLFLPQLIAWTILIILQPILAAIFAYLFLRHLKFRPQTSTIAAIAYGFSGWMAVWLEWNSLGFAYAFLPITLLLLDKLHPLTIIPLVLITLSGHPQVSLLILLFCFIYGLSRRLPWRFLILVFGLNLLITAVQWLPTAEYYLEASREFASSEFKLENTTLPWLQLVTLLAPTYFGHPATGNFWGQHNFVETTSFVGAAIFLLALLGKKRSFWGIAAASILIFVLPTPLTSLLKLMPLPILSTSVISRALVLLPICLVVLAAQGLESHPKLKKLFVFTALFIAGLIVYAFFEKIHTPTTFRNLVIPIGVSLFTFVLVRFKWHWLLVPLILFDLGFFAKKTITFTEPQFIFPQVPVINWLQQQTGFDRIGAEKASNIEANLTLYYGLATAEGYDALYPRRIGELVWAAKDGKFSTDFSRSTVVVPQYEDKLNQRIMDLLSLKYIINQNKNLTWPSDRYDLLWQQDNWQVYENLQALPRAKLFSQYQLMADSQTAVETLLNSNFDYQHILILSQTPQVEPQPDPTATATITQYLSQRVTITTQSTQPQLLLLNDTYYPGWRTTVDGQPTQILRANHAFRAAAVPAGNHQVIFKYDPLSVKLGMAISLIGLSLAAYEIIRHRSGL